MAECGKDSRVVVLLVDRNDVRPAALLHAIVGSLETCVVSARALCPSTGYQYVVARRGECSGMLTLPRKDALADFSNHRGLWLEGWIAMGIGMGLAARVRVRLWGLGIRRAEGADYISKISSWPGGSRPRAPIAPPAASRATTEPWSRSTCSDTAAALRPETRGHSWLSVRRAHRAGPCRLPCRKECNEISRFSIPSSTCTVSQSVSPLCLYIS